MPKAIKSLKSNFICTTPILCRIEVSHPVTRLFLVEVYHITIHISTDCCHLVNPCIVLHKCTFFPIPQRYKKTYSEISYTEFAEVPTRSETIFTISFVFQSFQGFSQIYSLLLQIIKHFEPYLCSLSQIPGLSPALPALYTAFPSHFP